MTRNAAWKKRVRTYAAEHGLTYQQAHAELTAQAAAGPVQAGRYLVMFEVLGYDYDIEPFTLDVQNADDLRNQLHDVIAARGWADFWVELDGLVGKVRVNVQPPNADVIGTFRLHPQGDTVEEPTVELPRSLHHDAHELIDVLQRRLDCTVDAITMVRGKHGDQLEHVALAYWAGSGSSGSCTSRPPTTAWTSRCRRNRGRWPVTRRPSRRSRRRLASTSTADRRDEGPKP